MSCCRINSFSRHYRNKLGCSVGKISLDLGVVCPNREKGGCIYCSPPAFSPFYLQGKTDIATQLKNGKRQLKRNKYSMYFAYFQQETVTAAAQDVLLDSVKNVLGDRDCVGVIISTRPDYIADDLLMELAGVCRLSQKECLFELGLQSCHERSLILLNRNHTLKDFTNAVKRIKGYDCFQVGVHLIFGIPGESEEDMLESAAVACGQGADALKIHHLQVLQGTPLKAMYDQGEVKLFTLEQYFEFLMLLLPAIPKRIVIHRLWATSHPHLLVAPKWDILATVLSRRLLDEMERRGIEQGQNC